MVMAVVYAQAGEIENAIDELEVALSVPNFASPAWFRMDPLFDPLRGNPRFEELLTQEFQLGL